MKTQKYNYRSGLQIIPENVTKTVIDSIENIDCIIGRCNIRNFNKEIMSKLHSCGWSDCVPLSVYSKISITSTYNEIGLCIQTGNVARTYADLLKLQTLYTDGKIRAGIVVLPSKECADAIGKNVANYERFIRELTYIFSRVITIPMLLIFFNNT